MRKLLAVMRLWLSGARQRKEPRLAASLPCGMDSGHEVRSWNDPLMWWPRRSPTPERWDITWGDDSPGDGQASVLESVEQTIYYDGDGDGI